MPEFAGECRRRDSEDWALGVGQAVAAHLGKGHPGQRAAAASAHDQHIAGAAGKVHQNPARRSSLYLRLYQRITGNLPPRRDERVPEPPTGDVVPLLAQIPVGAAVTTGRLPGHDRDQDRIVGTGHNFPVTQRLQAAR